MKLYACLLIVFSVFAAPTLAADLSLTGGAFYFNATDYYYPNFYDEAGFRGEINWRPDDPAYHHNLRLQCYGYPGDDNIFEAIAEYGLRLPYESKGWELEATPVAGLAVAKFQYPAPYYPKVTHQYLPWGRAGVEGCVGRRLGTAVAVRAAYRFRALLSVGSNYEAFLPSRRGRRTQLLHTPYGEMEVKLNARWRALGRGGCEWGGYYNPVFLPKDKKARPFGEVGFGLNL